MRQPQDIAPPQPAMRLSAVIPARDEAEFLPATFEALANQRDLSGQPVDPGIFEVIVLANNCTDDTAQLARRLGERVAPDLAVHVVEVQFLDDQAHVGTARRWLMDLACARLEAVGRPRGLIASTDADTRVAPNWVSASLFEVDAGADAVAGSIQVDLKELHQLGHSARRAYWLDRVHRRLLVELEAIIDPNPLDPFPRHDFHGGASLAITPEMYRRVGGLPPLRRWEDVALAEALWRADARFVHSPRVRVRTSTRQVGRALGGYSQTLSRWSIENATVWVDSAQRSEEELVARRKLRRMFFAKQNQEFGPRGPRATDLADLGRTFQVPIEPLLNLLTHQNTFGQWLEAMSQLQTARSGWTEHEKVPIADAVSCLQARLREIKKVERT